MTEVKERFFELLPRVYRQRDEQEGWRLRALLKIINEQADIVEQDLTQLYTNWFIETCDDWVVPYIGDLIGYEPVHDAGQPGDVASAQNRRRNKILIPRAEVANTIRNRRRKGTLALLELLAQDVADWPTRAVEFYSLLGFTQNVNHVRVERGRTVDLRNGNALTRINGAFDEVAHTVDIRRPNSHRTLGKYNIPSIGLFIWRLKTYSVTNAPLYLLENKPRHFFSFSVLANDMQLFTRSVVDAEQTRIANETNLPVPIRREAFEEIIKHEGGTESKIASKYYYGVDKSIAIWAEDWPPTTTRPATEPIPRELVIPANLSGWKYQPDPGFVAVDPVLGRIVFPPTQFPKKGVQVYYHYGFSTEIGGGEYARPIIEPSAHALSLSLFRLADFKTSSRDVLVNEFVRTNRRPIVQFLWEQFSDEGKERIKKYHPNNPEAAESLAALAALADELTAVLQAGPLYDISRFAGVVLSKEANDLLKQNDLNEQELIRLNRVLLEDAFPNEIARSYAFYRLGPGGEYKSFEDVLLKWHEDKPRNAVIEITDSGVYGGPVDIKFSPEQSLQIRAAQRTRPAIRLLDINFSGPDAIWVVGAAGSRLDFDGLLIFGRGIYIEGEMAEVNIRHSTLVPGWELQPNCEPVNPYETSLRLVDTNTCLHVAHSILGTIIVEQQEVKTDPVQICMSDSILDATSNDEDALSGGACTFAHANLKIARSTVIGHIHTHSITLAENSIFTGVVIVARRQIGCMRFSYVEPMLEATENKPELHSRTPRRFNCQPDLVERTIQIKIAGGTLSESQKEAEVRLERLRVRPQLQVRYGNADYGRLYDTTAEEIKRGAEDESEMGVYHDLFQPQREANLRTRLDEYTPAGMDAGIFFVS